MEILKSICTRAHQEGQDLHCSVKAAKQIQHLIEHPNAIAAASAGDIDTIFDVTAVDANGNVEMFHDVQAKIDERIWALE